MYPKSPFRIHHEILITLNPISHSNWSGCCGDSITMACPHRSCPFSHRGSPAWLAIRQCWQICWIGINRSLVAMISLAISPPCQLLKNSTAWILALTSNFHVSILLFCQQRLQHGVTLHTIYRFVDTDFYHRTFPDLPGFSLWSEILASIP
jgi:hypothetical protein